MFQPNAAAVMRPQDIEAFRRVAKIQKIYILVRQTNPQSLQWMGDKDCMSKPFDCKPKTADYDVNVNGRTYETAGLVVNASLPGFTSAFKSKKISKAVETWEKWATHVQLGESNPGHANVRTWKGHEPGWATDMNPQSRHYGCLMWSNYPQGMNGKYVFGDYDLFGIASAAEPTDIRRVKEERTGGEQTRGPRTYDVQFTVNAMLGAPMIRHGEQELFADFEDEALDVFCPDGSLVVLANDKDAREFYAKRMGGRTPFTDKGEKASKEGFRPF